MNGPNTPYDDAYKTTRSAFTGLVDHVNGGFRGRMEEERHTGVGSFKVGKGDQVRVLSCGDDDDLIQDEWMTKWMTFLDDFFG